MNVANIIASPPNDDLLCEYCSHMFKDRVVHYVSDSTAHSFSERDVFIIMLQKMSAFLFNMEDCDFAHVLLCSPCHYLENVTVLPYKLKQEMCNDVEIPYSLYMSDPFLWFSG